MRIIFIMGLLDVQDVEGRGVRLGGHDKMIIRIMVEDVHEHHLEVVGALVKDLLLDRLQPPSAWSGAPAFGSWLQGSPGLGHDACMPFWATGSSRSSPGSFSPSSACSGECGSHASASASRS